MDDHKSLFARGTDAVKDAGKHLADQYKSAMDKVTGAEMTRNMEEVQSEMEVVYSAIVMRLITLEETVEVLQRKTTQLSRIFWVTLIVACAGIVAIVAARWRV
jgi:uncharacterized protein HemX